MSKWEFWSSKFRIQTNHNQRVEQVKKKVFGFRPSKCYRWYEQTVVVSFHEYKELLIWNVMLVFCDRYARRSRVPPRVRTALQRDLLAVWAGPDHADSGRLPSAPVVVRSATPSVHQHLGPQHRHTHRQGWGEACHVQGIDHLADYCVLKTKPPDTVLDKTNLVGKDECFLHSVYSIKRYKITQWQITHSLWAANSKAIMSYK